jgi:hypothetical protein
MRTTTLSAALLCLLLFSCNKPEENEDRTCYIRCTERPSSPVLKGYSSDEIDTVIVKYFKPDRTFSKQVKEVVFTGVGGNADTMTNRTKMTLDYDYMVVLPHIDTIRISAFPGPSTTMQGTLSGSGHCMGFCPDYNHFIINGDTVYSERYYKVELVK